MKPVLEMISGNQSKPLLCCNQKYNHSECFPIEVDEADTTYSSNFSMLII